MTDSAITFDRVAKRFRRGEFHDSLRDLIPALTKRLFSKRNPEELATGEFWALHDVSFDIGRGEALGLVGRNGAGKSTVLKLISGILRPNLGSVTVNGRLSALIEVGAGFHPDLTGRENVFLNGTILGMTRREIRAKFDQIVDFAGLADFIDTPVKRYSSGMYARLGFAVAIHVNPEILLVDEVLSVGDYVFQKKCLDRMQTITESGTTVLFVSHNLRAIQALCPRSILIEGGQVVHDGKTREVTKQYLERGTLGAAAEKGAAAVSITDIRVTTGDGPCYDFDSGQTARVEVEVSANRPVENLAASIEFKDDSLYPIFTISTERLGHEPVDLAAGETWRIGFDIDLHLATGIYHLGAKVYEFDASSGRGLIPIDQRFPALSISVVSPHGVLGVVDMEPRVVELSPSSGAIPGS